MQIYIKMILIWFIQKRWKTRNIDLEEQLLMLEMSWGGEINVIKHAIFAGVLVNISFCVHIP